MNNELGLSKTEKWHYITSTLWQLSYPQMVHWLRRHKNLDEAFEAARRERDGMICT